MKNTSHRVHGGHRERREDGGRKADVRKRQRTEDRRRFKDRRREGEVDLKRSKIKNSLSR
ncbi:MAG: hypothetical protein JRJ45_07915 [Deltaproteobacteria bacterium]|nr:hypothetical protein [Deltaproteobacteria bacterium]